LFPWAVESIAQWNLIDEVLQDALRHSDEAELKQQDTLVTESHPAGKQFTGTQLTTIVEPTILPFKIFLGCVE